MKTTITDYVIVVIVGLWVLTVFRSMYDHGYQIPSSVQVAMGAVAAFLFGSRNLKRR